MAESEPEGSREEGGERRSEGGEGTKRGNRFARDARIGERKGKPLCAGQRERRTEGGTALGGMEKMNFWINKIIIERQ